MMIGYFHVCPGLECHCFDDIKVVWTQTVTRDDGCSCDIEAGIVCFAHTGYVESIRDEAL